MYTGLWHFLIFNLFGKDGKSLWRLQRLLGYSKSTSSYITVFIIVFYKIFIKFRSIFFHSKSFTGNFWDITYSYRLSTSKYIKYIFCILSCIYCLLLHIDVLHEIFLLLFLFLRLITYQYQLIILIVFLNILNMLAMLILVQIKSELDQVLISIHFFGDFQIYLQVITYRFEQ